MDARIKISCDGCGIVHDVTRTKEIPDNVISLGCNWCPACEDSADGYYEEWYNYNDGNKNDSPNPVPDNQLCLPFIFEEIGITEIKESVH